MHIFCGARATNITDRSFCKTVDNSLAHIVTGRSTEKSSLWACVEVAVKARTTVASYTHHVARVADSACTFPVLCVVAEATIGAALAKVW